MYNLFIDFIFCALVLFLEHLLPAYDLLHNQGYYWEHRFPFLLPFAFPVASFACDFPVASIAFELHLRI